MATKKRKHRKRKSIYKYKNHQYKDSLSRRELKIKAVNYKGGKCVACGYNKCLQALSFHHRDPDEKDFGISRLINCLSWPEIERELQKTILLCVRCHVEFHSGVLDGYALL